MFIPIPLFLNVHSQCFLFILYCFSLSFAHFLDSTLFLFLLSGLYFVHLSPFLVSTWFLFFTVWTLLCSLISFSGILFSQSGLYFVKLSYFMDSTILCSLSSLSVLYFVHLSYFLDSTFFLSFTVWT